MDIVRRIFFAIIILSIAVTPHSVSAAEEDFNWTDAAHFVDSFPFKKQFVDSLFAAHRVAPPAAPLRTLAPQCFSHGEILVYDIGWSFIKGGGYVILTATPDTARRTLRLGAKALSRGFVSTFYRMRDYALSTVDAAGLYPLFFEEHLREGKHYKADKWFIFDNVKDSLYTNNRALPIPPFTNDYLSLLYMARAKRFAPGDTFYVPFFVDGRLYQILFSCKKRQKLELNGKNVNCLVVQPQPTDDQGAFNKKKGLEIWFSDDEYKLPLRIKAKIAIGSIIADLIFVSRPGSGATVFPCSPPNPSP